MDSEVIVGLVGVAGALLGAVVGAIVSYRASISLQKRARRSRAAIRRKAKLYTPLRAELLQLLDRLEQPDRYGIPIQTEGEVPQTVRPRPYFTLWSEMQADGRSVSVAASISQSIKLTLAEIENFNRTMQQIQATVDDVGRHAYREVTGTELSLMNWAESGGTDAVIQKRDDWRFFFGSEERVTHRNEENAIKEIVNRDERIGRAREAMRMAEDTLRRRLQDSVNSLETAMERIARKYEHEPPED